VPGVSAASDYPHVRRSVHVFVDREARRAVEIPAPLRAALERLVVAR